MQSYGSCCRTEYVRCCNQQHTAQKNNARTEETESPVTVQQSEKNNCVCKNMPRYEHGYM